MSRDLAAVEEPLSRWLAARLARQGVRARELRVDLDGHEGGGYSNEIILMTASFTTDGTPQQQQLVVRIPPTGAALFPTYDLAMQVAVQDLVGAHHVPVPHPIIHEADPSWLGAPFLVMARVVGHDLGELPAVDPWILAATLDQQAHLQRQFLDTLARIHRTPWRGQPGAAGLRGARGGLDDEISWWEDLASWSFDGQSPPEVSDAFAWCRAHQPAAELPVGVLWGDVRLGNVLFDDDYEPIAVLDWEMASLGPAELDLAWCTALDEMAEHFVGRRLPGFIGRDEIVSRHQQELGRPLVAFRWFEIFAMCRSAVLNIRADRLASIRRGRPVRPAADNAVLAYARAAIDQQG